MTFTSAYVRLCAAIGFEVLSFGVGARWDRMWHTTHPFEDFFSPPHLFIYTMHLFAMLALASIVVSAQGRAYFGRWPLAFASSGFGVVALAGVLDGVWHTAFGLVETAWSTPHSMLGWGLFVTFIGLASCRLAVRERRPVGWGSALVYGFLLLAGTIDHLAGPIGNNPSEEFLRAVARIPVLAAEPAFQHTIRIELAWNLTRHNPLFVPLAAASSGLAYGVLAAFDRRPLAILAISALLTRTALLPVIVPGIALAAFGSRRVTWWAWLASGLVYGAIAARIWDGTPLGAVASAPLLLAGALLGERVGAVMRAPTRTGVTLVAASFGIALPLATGAIDLWLRSVTP